MSASRLNARDDRSVGLPWMVLKLSPAVLLVDAPIMQHRAAQGNLLAVLVRAFWTSKGRPRIFPAYLSRGGVHLERTGSNFLPYVPCIAEGTTRGATKNYSPVCFCLFDAAEIPLMLRYVASQTGDHLGYAASCDESSSAGQQCVRTGGPV